MRSLLALPIAICGLTIALFAQEAADQPVVARSTMAKFESAKDLPDCITIAPARGNPSAGPSAVFLKAESNCIVPYHWHTANESLVPLLGLMQVTVHGERPKVVANGDYAYMPAQRVHMAKCASSKPCTAILQLDAAMDMHYVDKDGKEIPAEAALASVNQPTTKPTAKP
jgi:quercetin dioxygenase-like cupin family protein